MGDRMHPVSFGALMTRALDEYRRSGTLFGVRRLYRHAGGKALPIFGERIETPFGPAAGPHTQMAQNIVAAYAGGARFFELKTVQTLDGEDLPVAKPCILAREEGYNVEWSTELTVEQALGEYIKAWYALKLLSRELGLGDENGFVFNMSVGYDLKGVTSPKIDRFIETLKDATDSRAFRACEEWTLANLGAFGRVDEAFARAVSPRVCRSITLSTLHGCPAGEIESIARHLIGQKKLNTYVKCNPTLLGYDFARSTMDALGYSELVFDDHHFRDDLQFEDAVPMFTRLEALARENGVEFGLKLSNTFPVGIARGELPGQEMYMSGKALYPLTAALAGKIERAFGGRMRVSYSGGADAKNVGALFDCHIWPITMATTLLKPGGYNRLAPIAEALARLEYAPFGGVDTRKLDALAAEAAQSPRYRRPLKAPPSRKLDEPSPLRDCFVAPCERGCPIRQDITAYLDLARAGRYAEAVEVVCRKNPLPFITGTICPHRCQSRCTRHFYEDSIHIREVKLLAAQKGFDAYLQTVAKPAKALDERVAVVGGGPGGMAAACFAARAGARVTLFEKRGALGGVVRHVIPSFRIADEAVDQDARLLAALGVEVRLNEAVQSVDELYAQGFTRAVLATGAWQAASVRLEAGEGVDALAFLEAVKRDAGAYAGAKHIVVTGGGNTAMDAARAALRVPGVESVCVAYRRTAREMPADEEELSLALSDGARFMPLRAPRRLENGTLTLDVMALGERDESGRRSPKPTGEAEAVPCDLLLLATGEKPDAAYLRANGVRLDERGRATSIRQNDRLWLVGDAYAGPATVAEAIANAREAVDDMLGLAEPEPVKPCASVADVLRRRGELRDFSAAMAEADRCQHCGEICENCADVCPNRANVAVEVAGCVQPQIVHVDALCNECGNCEAFCPYSGAPYRDKFTLFDARADFDQSGNQGLLPLPDGRSLVRLGGAIYEDDAAFSASPTELRGLLAAARALEPREERA